MRETSSVSEELMLLKCSSQVPLASEVKLEEYWSICPRSITVALGKVIEKVRLLYDLPVVMKVN